MFKIIAPYPTYQMTTILPSPDFSNGQRSVGTINKQRAMDGTLYTHIKRKQERQHFQWSFELSRHKAIELKQLVNLYYGLPMRVVDHTNATYLGYIINNPVEFTANGKAEGWPGGETYLVTIEFEEME